MEDTFVTCDDHHNYDNDTLFIIIKCQSYFIFCFN